MLAALAISLLSCQGNGLFRTCPSAPVDDPAYGDGLVFLERSNTATFWETTDVAVKGDAVYTCTGVASFAVHDASDPDGLKHHDTLVFRHSDPNHPRCNHIDVKGDRALVVSAADEVQPVPWLALLDVSDPLEPRILDDPASPGPLYDQGVILGEGACVAAHEDGLACFSIAEDRLEPTRTLTGFGNVARVARFGTGLAVGNRDGEVYVLSAGLETLGSVELDAAVQDLHELPDGRLAAALGSAGVALLDTATWTEVHRIDTGSTALQLDLTAAGALLVANWADVRIYDTAADPPSLLVVEAVLDAATQPRTLAAATAGDRVFAGEWTGLYAYRLDPDAIAPEIRPVSTSVRLDPEAPTADLTVENEGQLTLEITDLDVPRGWTAELDSERVEPGDRTVVHLAAEPGADSGELLICSNDPDEAPARVQLYPDSAALTVGDAAPDFSYIGLNTNEQHKLSDQRGHPVVLSYFATF